MHKTQTTTTDGPVRAEAIFEPLHFDEGTGLDGKPHLFIYQYPHTGWPLADMGLSTGAMKKQTFANARLFASAPLMLKCLERIESVLRISFDALSKSDVNTPEYWQRVIDDLKKTLGARAAMTMTPGLKNTVVSDADTAVIHWTKAYPQPFGAIQDCAVQHGLLEVAQQFVWSCLADWADDLNPGLLDGLLEGLAGATNIVVQKSPDGWVAALAR